MGNGTLIISAVAQQLSLYLNTAVIFGYFLSKKSNTKQIIYI